MTAKKAKEPKKSPAKKLKLEPEPQLDSDDEDEDDTIKFKNKRKISRIIDSDSDYECENNENESDNSQSMDVDESTSKSRKKKSTNAKAAPKKKIKLDLSERKPLTESKAGTGKSTTAQMPLAETEKEDADVLDVPVVWRHNTIDFLKPDQICDANKKRPNDPDYDPTTLYVPTKFLDSQTPVCISTQ